MKSLTALAFTLALLGFGCASTPAPPPPAHMMSDVEPPMPQAEESPVRQGFIWTAGHWSFADGQWTWQPGHYERERAGLIWTNGRWEKKGPQWCWTPGCWSPHD